MIDVVQRTGLLLFVISLSPIYSSSADASVSVPLDAGDLTIVDSLRPGVEIDGGGSAIEFSLRLPPGSSCPGDTENDGWLVQSFLIPAEFDPGKLKYDNTGPVSKEQGRFPLPELTSRPYSNRSTEPNSQSGQPGLIPGPPALTLGVYIPGLFPDGQYTMGLACELNTETRKYWDVPVVITASFDDKPGGFTWRTLGSVDNDAGSTESGIRPWQLIAAAGALFVVASMSRLRRNQRAKQEKVDIK